MTRTPHRLLLAALLATSGAIALAQTPTPVPPAPAPASEVSAQPPAAGYRGDRMDPAWRHQRMSERHARRMAELKAALKITPAQESAWNTFDAAMQPPAQPPSRAMSRADMEQLTTPERIDRMQKRRAERNALMQQRGDAVKAFYAQLTPEQQETFDRHARRFGKHMDHGFGHDKDHKHMYKHGPRY